MSPFQIFCAPNSPSPLRARKPPRRAAKRNILLNLECAGTRVFVSTYVARISSGSTNRYAFKSGQLRLRRIRWVPRQAATRIRSESRSATYTKRVVACPAPSRRCARSLQAVAVSRNRVCVYDIPHEEGGLFLTSNRFASLKNQSCQFSDHRLLSKGWYPSGHYPTATQPEL
jgi:hypothetical protein